MKSSFKFLKILALCFSILVFIKNADAQCSGFNVTIAKTADGPVSNDVILQATVTGGSNQMMYRWSSNYYYGLNYSQNYNRATIGNYVVHVFDSINNCSDSAIITVTMDTSIAPCPSLVSIVQVSDGPNLNDAVLQVSSNYANNTTYLWSNTNGQVIGSSNSLTVGNNEYTLTVIDTINKCYSSNKYSILDTSINNLVTSKWSYSNIDTLNIGNSICDNDSLNLYLNFNKNAGTTRVSIA